MSGKGKWLHKCLWSNFLGILGTVLWYDTVVLWFGMVAGYVRYCGMDSISARGVIGCPPMSGKSAISDECPY